jgi:hypothetical protein
VTFVDFSASLLIIAICVVVMGPMVFLLWLKLRDFWRSLIALRDWIDRSQRW